MVLFRCYIEANLVGEVPSYKRQLHRSSIFCGKYQETEISTRFSSAGMSVIAPDLDNILPKLESPTYQTCFPVRN